MGLNWGDISQEAGLSGTRPVVLHQLKAVCAQSSQERQSGTVSLPRSPSRLGMRGFERPRTKVEEKCYVTDPHSAPGARQTDARQTSFLQGFCNWMACVSLEG